MTEPLNLHASSEGRDRHPPNPVSEVLELLGVFRERKLKFPESLGPASRLVVSVNSPDITHNALTVTIYAPAPDAHMLEVAKFEYTDETRNIVVQRLKNLLFSSTMIRTRMHKDWVEEAQSTEEEIVAELQNVRLNGGQELTELIQELEDGMQDHELTNPS